MGSINAKTWTSVLAALTLLLAACGNDGAGPEPDAQANEAAEEHAAPAEDASDEVAADPDDAAVDGEEDDGGATPPAGAGTAVVTIGDERYETNDLLCPDSLSGVEFDGVAEGPRDNARIHGRFASEMLPDLIAVSFARGDDGEWSAVAENNLIEQGVLEDYTFDEAARTYNGTATFVWIPERGLQDPDSLTDGSFEVVCG